MKRVLRTTLCITGCIAALAAGTTSGMQTVSGQAEPAICASYHSEGSHAGIATVKKSSMKNAASGWSKDKKHYFDNNGEMVTGIVLIEGKFYSFKNNGQYDKSTTKKVQKAAAYEKPFSKLKKYIGKPNKSKYLASCYGKGKDGILTYDNFEVYTFRPDKGKEIFMGAE